MIYQALLLREARLCFPLSLLLLPLPSLTQEKPLACPLEGMKRKLMKQEPKVNNNKKKEIKKIKN